MARTKTTIYIDEDLMQSARDLAARTDRAEQDILEDALRRYIGLQMLGQIWNNEDLPDEDEAMRLAYEELHAMRAEQDQGDEYLA